MRLLHLEAGILKFLGEFATYCFIFGKSEHGVELRAKISFDLAPP